MKKEIIQTLKIVSLGLIVSAGFAFANTWTTMPANPPSNDVSTAINVGPISQVKAGALGTGPLVVFGTSSMTGNVNVLGTSNLYVSGKVGIGVQNPTQKFEVAGSIKISNLVHVAAGYSSVCSDTDGQIVLCPVYSPAGSINYTTPGAYTWTVPADVTSTTFKVWGGGGGGGAGGADGLSMGFGGAGGGAGGVYSVTIPVTPGETFAVTVGSGGALGTNGYQTVGNPGGSGTVSKVVRQTGTVTVSQGNGGGGGGGGGKPTYSGMVVTGYPAPASVGIGGIYSGISGGVGWIVNSLSPATFSATPYNFSCGTNGATAGGSAGGNGGIAFSDSDNCQSPYSGSTGGIVVPDGGPSSSPGGGGSGGSGRNYALASGTSGKSTVGANGRVMIIW